MNKSALKILIFYLISMISFQIATEVFLIHLTDKYLLIMNLIYTVTVIVTLLYLFKFLKLDLDFLKFKLSKKDYYIVGISSLILIIVNVLFSNHTSINESKSIFFIFTNGYFITYNRRNNSEKNYNRLIISEQDKEYYSKLHNIFCFTRS